MAKQPEALQGLRYADEHSLHDRIKHSYYVRSIEFHVAQAPTTTSKFGHVL
jgi:hypothetical protein